MNRIRPRFDLMVIVDEDGNIVHPPYEPTGSELALADGVHDGRYGEDGGEVGVDEGSD